MNPLVSFGNRKLHKSVMIFNMTSATHCPAARLGLCKVADICYAMKAERMYPECLPYRERQAAFWQEHTADEIADALIRWAKKTTKFFRFSEAGDFEAQADVDKMALVCRRLRDERGLRCYGYTARYDLNLYPIARVAHVLVSGASVPGCAEAIVVRKKEKPPVHTFVCPGKGCMSMCFACANGRLGKIVFKEH